MVLIFTNFNSETMKTQNLARFLQLGMVISQPSLASVEDTDEAAEVTIGDTWHMDTGGQVGGVVS